MMDSESTEKKSSFNLRKPSRRDDFIIALPKAPPDSIQMHLSEHNVVRRTAMRAD